MRSPQVLLVLALAYFAAAFPAPVSNDDDAIERLID